MLSMVVMAYNLVVLFERFLGWMDRYAVQSLRFHLFTTPGIISQTGGITTIKLAAPPARRSWWMRLWERIASPFPNCNAVEPLFGGTKTQKQPNGQKLPFNCMDTA